ncbi:hypothetical protein PENNAL_c0341G08059 [Penicillium nalgiovense]|uniref:Uncharacterized protein n=1 Tax=Penicillium nalgiovense TaxID=60175 RepID=A0A1V6W8K4_PENNA|nr:hypothetical protein PENNAL_c0341G08059 [Penicillium nalgiovense]
MRRTMITIYLIITMRRTIRRTMRRTMRTMKLFLAV